MDNESDLRADIERAFAQVSSAKEQQQQQARRIEEPITASTVRFRVTKWVLWSYLAYAIGVGLFIMFFGEPAKNATLIDIMKTLLLPIVTLVIGFYFGSKAE
jgi:hypothetical protein